MQRLVRSCSVDWVESLPPPKVQVTSYMYLTRCTATAKGWPKAQLSQESLKSLAASIVNSC